MNTQKQIIKAGYVDFKGRLFSIDVVKSKSTWTRFIFARYDLTLNFRESELCRKKEVNVSIEDYGKGLVLVIHYNPKYTIIDDIDLNESKKINENLPQISF